MHFIRHAVDVRVSAKNKSNMPAIIAPTTLVAAKVIASNITVVSTVPRIPVSSTVSVGHRQSRMLRLVVAVSINNTASHTTAIPNSTHKNAGVTVTVAVYTRKLVIIPIIILATTASAVQLVLQPQFIFVIIFTSVIIYDKPKKGVNFTPFPYKLFISSVTASFVVSVAYTL